MVGGLPAGDELRTFNDPKSIVRTEDFPNTPVLSNRVAHFDLTDATFVDALSKLSFEPIAGLHLGIEKIIRDKSSEPTDGSIRFSLSLHDVTVRDTWSTDGSSINIYPRETVGNSPYLLNRELDLIALKNINGPSDALTP